MTMQIQATGFMGIAFEAVEGTYVAPTKSFPIISESLKFNQDTQWRRVIRGIADELGAVAGNTFIDGEVEMELLEDVLPYFLHASRNTVAKTGLTPDFTYTSTPQHGAFTAASALGKPTLSLTVVRNGVAHGFTGCRVSQIRITQNNGVARAIFSIVGREETNQAVPVPVYSNTVPYGMGSYDIQIPTGTTVFDVDNFEFSANDNASPVHRLWTARTPRAVKYGEREVTLSFDRDFLDRTEFDLFKALTARSITVQITKSITRHVHIKVPVGIMETYEIGGLSSQGDLVRASVNVRGEYDTATSKAYEIACRTNEDIT